MKKIISLLATVAMVSTLFVSVVKADFQPTLTMVVGDKLTNAEFSDFMEEDIPEGYDVYPVSVSFSNLGDLNCTVSAKKHTGRKIQNFGFEMTFDDIDSVNTDCTMLYDNVFGSLSEGFDESTYRAIFNAGKAGDAYPNTNGASISNAEGIEDALIVWVVVASGKTVTATLSANVDVITYSKDVPGEEEHQNNATMSPASVQFGAAAPATVDVTSVTISGATAATVGDDVQLSATVLPDNATDKTVTWTKVSGNGAVSDSGVVTATAAGDVVVKATAGGVDSANYTVSFAAPAPTPVYTDSSIDVKKPVNGTTGLTDLQGDEVTLTANYGIAKFSKAIDTVANNYFVVATDSENVEKEFEVDFAANGVEISNASTTFFAIVKSADHIIKSIRLKEIAK